MASGKTGGAFEKRDRMGIMKYFKDLERTAVYKI